MPITYATGKSYPMNRGNKILTFCLVIFLSSSALPINHEIAWSVPAQGVGLPITAPSALLIDVATQRIIYAKAPHSRRPPASTAKLMTALVVLEKSRLDKVVQIPGWASSIQPSKVYLRRGEHYRVRDLLQAMLISSANDAAEVLAVTTAGSRPRFAQWMNERARRIGCRDTHFANPSGLPSAKQYSSSYDLALIMREARKSAFIVNALSQKYRSIQSLEGRKIWLRNHNRFLWQRPRSVIGKTGYTRAGQHCFVGRIQWKGREVLVSLLGSHRLWTDLRILMDYQFGVALYKVYKNHKRWSESQTLAIQKALKRAGFLAGPVDGDFGPGTVRAVELFQKAHGLQPDGMVNLPTCKKLTHLGLSSSLCR